MKVKVIDSGDERVIGLRLSAENRADVSVLKRIICSDLDMSYGGKSGGKLTHVVIHGRRKVIKSLK